MGHLYVLDRHDYYTDIIWMYITVIIEPLKLFSIIFVTVTDRSRPKYRSVIIREHTHRTKKNTCCAHGAE